MTGDKVRLYFQCPGSINTMQSSNESAKLCDPICFYWTHTVDGGDLWINQKGMISCAHCGYTEFIAKWGFNCGTTKHQQIHQGEYVQFSASALGQALNYVMQCLIVDEGDNMAAKVTFLMML